MLNPFHIAGITKEVLHNLYVFIYTTYFPDLFDQEIANKTAKHDIKIDFSRKEWLGLADFYDGFFECVDKMTKSNLATEYVRFVKSVIKSLQGST